MRQEQQGMVIPFRVTASRARRSAAEYRRRGQPLEALVLLRRAAAEEDTAAGWLQLGEELHRLGCWEAASEMAARALSREDCPPAAWLLMARAMNALGKMDTAEDCLYHLLQEDPYSQEAETARSMLGDAFLTGKPRMPHRADALVRRGMQAWSEGSGPLARRRLRRALRIRPDRAQLLSALALTHMARLDPKEAVVCLNRALRAEPENPRANCILSLILHHMGRPVKARAVLRRAIPFCSGVMGEDQFLTAAWAMNAWPEMAAYLSVHMAKKPCRLTLLQARASMLEETGRTDAAEEVRRTILKILPGDRFASGMMSLREAQLLPSVPGKTPPEAASLQREEFLRLQADAAGTDWLAPGSRGREILCWFLCSDDEAEQQLALEAIELAPPARREECLRELLVCPFTHHEVRRQGMLKLAQAEPARPIRILLNERFAEMQCQRVVAQTPGNMWRRFLLALLNYARRYGSSADLADFAAMLWQMMSAEDREAACREGSLVWCSAATLLWLRVAGREREALQLTCCLPVSVRRIRRVMRRLGRYMDREPDHTGEGDTES